MDAVDLTRFVLAQDSGGTYDRAVAELAAGRKRSHWMWFVFPQLAGLGRSATARLYALDGVGEARAYLAHPVLGPRLRHATELLVGLPACSAAEVLGEVDALKLRSCMTLFARVAPAEQVFAQVLEHWYDGDPDPRTTGLLEDV